MKFKIIVCWLMLLPFVAFADVAVYTLSSGINGGKQTCTDEILAPLVNKSATIKISGKQLLDSTSYFVSCNSDKELTITVDSSDALEVGDSSQNNQNNNGAPSLLSASSTVNVAIQGKNFQATIKGK